MAQEQLKQEEIEQLLLMIKNTLTDSVNFPGKGQNAEFLVQGTSKRDLFKITIYRGGINREKYNFGAIIEKNNVLLLELHINPGNRHQNPDGTVINGSHWHIYSEEYGRKQAFPAEDIHSEKFIENTILFLERFNVVEKPAVQYQMELV